MSVVWGDFDSMAMHYIKMLASPIHKNPIWIQDGDGGPYGVCSYQEYAQLVSEHGEGKYRPVSTMDRVEFMGLLLVRYNDFFQEEENGIKKKDISTGELFSGESAALDAGGDQGSEGGRGKDNGSGEEEDNNRKIH